MTVKAKDTKSKEQKPRKTKEKGKSSSVPDYPKNLVFTRRHIWACPNRTNSTATIGITDYLADELGVIDSIEVPAVGDELEIESICIHIHVGNRLKVFRCPLTGRVLEINQDVIDDPSQIYLDYQKNWLFRMQYDDKTELDILMDGEQYTKYLDEL